MNRFLWIIYLTCAALVFGSWLGWIPSSLSWPAWLVGTGIALASWAGWLRPRPKLPTQEPTLRLTAEERERARREVDGDPPI
jgi:hypothetical protein